MASTRFASIDAYNDAPGGFDREIALRLTSPAQVDRAAVLEWLGEARTVQWDYKNIVKSRGQLERLP